MKTIKLFAITAAALVLGLSSCMKDVNTPSVDIYKVTLRLQSAATRAELPIAVPGTTVLISNGYICFVSANDAITDVYTISTNPTSGKNIRNTDLGAAPVTLENVPGTSARVYMITNTGSHAALTAPAVGGSMTAYLTNNMDVRDQGIYTTVTSTGSANLTAGSDSDARNAAITLSTDVARIQVKGITFDGDVTGKVAGIFINGYYPTMALNGTGNSLRMSGISGDYDEVNGSSVFPASLLTFVYDNVDKSFDTGTATVVGPALAGGVWAYHLFKSSTPQIIIKLTDVVVGGQALTTDQFITINGFKNSATSAVINALEGGMIYTINTESLVIKYEKMTPEPGKTLINVDVTLVPVTCQETQVTPNV